jgi:hypothetical protein
VTPTWIVWSVMPPEHREKISCTSMLDAARAWAERQFRNGLIARTGTEVLVRCENDPLPPRPASVTAPNTANYRSTLLTATTYRVKLTIINAPAFRANLLGIVNEAVQGNDPEDGSTHG